MTTTEETFDLEESQPKPTYRELESQLRSALTASAYWKSRLDILADENRLREHESNTVWWRVRQVELGVSVGDIAKLMNHIWHLALIGDKQQGIEQPAKQMSASDPSPPPANQRKPKLFASQ